MKLTIFSGAVLDRGKQKSCLVAAASAVAASRLLNKAGFYVSTGMLRKYWSKTQTSRILLLLPRLVFG